VYFLHIITCATACQAFLDESSCLRIGFHVTRFVFCSLYRSDVLHEAEVRFSELKDKVPVLVGISREVSSLSHKYTG
jgi:hypothetical protein